jgi:hypothetical protein
LEFLGPLKLDIAYGLRGSKSGLDGSDYHLVKLKDNNIPKVIHGTIEAASTYVFRILFFIFVIAVYIL